jgi:hypothetical protein
MIPDPELVKEVLSNKFGHFGKPKSSRIGKLLANGVVNHDGEKWAKHRRILNPAFHHEKIKVIFFSKGGKSFAGFLLDEEKGKKKELTNSKIKLL